VVTLVLDISVLGHFGPWTWLDCRILTGGCSGISTISRVKVRLRVRVRVRDRYVKGLKCPGTEVTVQLFGSIYHTEIIAIVQCIYADYVIWVVGQMAGGTLNGGVGSPNGKGQNLSGEVRQHNVGLMYRKNVAVWCGCSIPTAE